MGQTVLVACGHRGGGSLRAEHWRVSICVTTNLDGWGQRQPELDTAVRLSGCKAWACEASGRRGRRVHDLNPDSKSAGQGPRPRAGRVVSFGDSPCTSRVLV